MHAWYEAPSEVVESHSAAVGLPREHADGDVVTIVTGLDNYTRIRMRGQRSRQY
jgi:hypothetical protein